jgi:hemoglobin-like flavoprotein
MKNILAPLGSAHGQTRNAASLGLFRHPTPFGKGKVMTPQQIQLLRDSFARIESQAEIAALVFYRNLFTLAPELRAMFNTSIEIQARKLMESLRYTIVTLELPDELVPVLEGLGRRHAAYGTKDEHYAIVTQALMQMLTEVLDKEFTAPTAAAWQEALSFVCATMQRGAHEIPDFSQSH